VSNKAIVWQGRKTRLTIASEDVVVIEMDI
jgi:hypothetical protein